MEHLTIERLSFSLPEGEDNTVYVNYAPPQPIQGWFYVPICRLPRKLKKKLGKTWRYYANMKAIRRMMNFKPQRIVTEL